MNTLSFLQWGNGINKKTICVYRAISTKFRNSSFQKMATFHFRSPFCGSHFLLPLDCLLTKEYANFFFFFCRGWFFKVFSEEQVFFATVQTLLPQSRWWETMSLCMLGTRHSCQRTFAQITVSRALIWSPQNPKEHTGAKERAPGCVRVCAIITAFPVLGGIWDSEECGEWQWLLAFVRCDRQKENCWLSPPI